MYLGILHSENNNMKEMECMENKTNKDKENSVNGVKGKKIIACATVIVLVGIIIGLAVRNNRLKSSLDEKKDTERTATVTSAQKGQDSEQASESEEPTTEAELLMAPQSEILYTDIEVGQPEMPEVYNGDDLEYNGYPYAIKINRQENIVTIYEVDDNGYYTVPVKVMRCSVSPVGETPLGLFTIALKWDWLALFDNCYGQYVSQIDGDTLFHSVPYLDTTKDSLETWEFNKLGTGASLGCVRLCVADTKWIYENCESGTYVDIFDSDYYGPLGRPVPVTKLQNTEEQGWDPTDMVEENPTTGHAVIYGVESHSIELGENYDVMAGVWAFNSNREDATSELVVEGKVNNKKAGEYPVKYSFTDNGKEVTKTIIITVEDDQPPVITRIPVELKVYSYEGQKEQLAQIVASYITAHDGGTPIKLAYATDGKGSRVDGVKISTLKENAICVAVNNVGTEAGSYSVRCCAVDASGNKSPSYNIKITVVK